MKGWLATGLMVVLGFALDGVPAWAQVVESQRDVTITGPRGRSIQRDTTIERGPGFVDRQLSIKRPGGTFQSNTLIQRAPSVVRGGGGFVPAGRPGGWGWGPRPFIGREVIINNGGGPASWIAPLAVGLGSFGVGMFAGNALANANAPPPQPVYAVPPPVYVIQPAPGTVAYPPQPVVPAQPAQPPPPAPDPVTEAVLRLQSHHANSRREGAYTLGRLHDPRAIPALVERLKNDSDVDVRVAAASALGEIGDPRAGIYLERVTIYDKKQKVRDAAALALTRLPREPGVTGAPSVAASPTPPQPEPGLTPIPSNMMPAPTVPAGTSAPVQPEPIERVPPPPTPVPAPRTSTGGPGFPQNQ
jgi:hypothetical protein